MKNKDNKTIKIAIFFLILIITAFMGCKTKVVSKTYQIVGEESPTQEEINDTIDKLKKRAEYYSGKVKVYQEGTDCITIEMSGVSDVDVILKEFVSPGDLYFIAQTDSEGNLNYDVKTTVDGQIVYYDELGNEFYYISDNSAVYFDDTTFSAKLDENGNAISYPLGQEQDINIQYMLLKPIDELKADGSIILEGSEVESAKEQSYQDQQSGLMQYVVTLSFNETGKQAFTDATTKAVASGETIAIYYDGNIISVPRVNETITTGEAFISGLVSYEYAHWLADKIRIGALKLTLKEV